MDIALENGGLHLLLRVEENGRVGLRHFGAQPYAGDDGGAFYPLLELHTLGGDIGGHHGSRHTQMQPGTDLRYRRHTLADAPGGRELMVELAGDGLAAAVHYRFYDGVPAVQCCTAVENTGSFPVVLDYLTSFCYYGVSDGMAGSFEDDALISFPYNTWHGELQWHTRAAWEHGLMDMDCSCLRRLVVSQVGTWSCGEYMPLGAVTDRRTQETLFWQIEHNGSWAWEMSTVQRGGLYLHLTGPNGERHAFQKRLSPGERFCSVPVAVGACPGGLQGAARALTAYRRRIRRDNRDDRDLPIIFNDYMNCLMGDPTEKRVLPLVDAAAAAGCEYYVMDAGWFSQKEGGDDDWWSSIGVWEEAAFRFPHGLRYVMDYVRARGMTPGLWVELEGIGPDSPLAASLPDDWFFCLGGRRVMQHYRYQLDYRNEHVRAWASGIVDRLIREYHVGYLKLDYNINAGIGTDVAADSPGEGLLGHCRAFLGWLDELFSRHPDLVIENCASGGMRMDYAMLSRLSIQSTSDQLDYRRYSVISAMAATAVAPEPSACWTYPSLTGDEEETAYNMINAMLGRIHQSGHLDRLPERTRARVHEALAVYRQIRGEIRTGLPTYPLGAVTFKSPWAAYGLLCRRRLYLAVWRRDTDRESVTLPLPDIGSAPYGVRVLYPQGLPVTLTAASGALTVGLPARHTARLLVIDF